jgi:hypothetical protein
MLHNNMTRVTTQGSSDVAILLGSIISRARLLARTPVQRFRLANSLLPHVLFQDLYPVLVAARHHLFVK